MPCCGARRARLATYGLASGPQATARCASFSPPSSRATPGLSCSFDDILIVSGSLQALDLVNGVLLARGDTVIIEQESYQGALTRLARLGVEGGRHSARPATACAWMRSRPGSPALARRNIRPKYIYTIPTVQNPTGHDLERAAPRRAAGAVRALRRADLRGRCYADLVWDGSRPPALHAMSTTGGVIHIGSFLQVDRAPALGSASSSRAGTCSRACSR